MKLVKYKTILNISIQIVASAVAIYGLWLSSNAVFIPYKLAGILLFALSANTVFSLLHESVHKLYSKNYIVNELMGMLAAAIFPTGLTFQRLCHLSHHNHNRSDNEMFDLYYPTDNLLLKRIQFFGIFTGFYWLIVVLGWVLFLLVPGIISYIGNAGNKSKIFKHADVAILLPLVKSKNKNRIRLELVLTICIQVLLFKVFSLSFIWWIISYWVFSLFWGALQYADHAYSPRDVKTGAWDLRINPVIRYIFLNYHHHRAHHIHPNIPWFQLGQYIDKDNYRPTFWEIYLKMWKGPIPATEPNPLKPLKGDL